MTRIPSIIIVHLAGIPADAQGITRTARRHEVPVIEDMAQS